MQNLVALLEARPCLFNGTIQCKDDPTTLGFLSLQTLVGKDQMVGAFGPKLSAHISYEFYK